MSSYVAGIMSQYGLQITGASTAKKVATLTKDKIGSVKDIAEALDKKLSIKQVGDAVEVNKVDKVASFAVPADKFNVISKKISTLPTTTGGMQTPTLSVPAPLNPLSERLNNL